MNDNETSGLARHFTDENVTILNAARGILHKIEYDYANLNTSAEGIVAALAEVASDSIFDVLNNARTRIGAEIPDAQMFIARRVAS